MAVKIATSKHLRTSTELTLVVPILRKFVRSEANDSISMATRLGALLQTLFELRRASVERAVDAAVGPLERMRTLYNFSWSVFDGGSKLLLAVNFDRPWEPYIRSIVDLAGPFLDAIFCHCEGYESSSTEDGYLAFAAWVRRWQIDVSLFYAAEPDLTVDDQRYLREFERMYREFGARPRFEQRVARLALGEPGADGIPPTTALAPQPGLIASRDAADRRLTRAASALAQVRQLFGVHADDEEVGAAERARRFFDRAAWLLLAPIADQAAISRLPDSLRDILTRMEKVDAEGRQRGSASLSAESTPALTLAELEKNVQANILTPCPHMTHGCLLLIGFDSKKAGQDFVRQLAEQVTPHSLGGTKELKLNVALTYQGFRTLGLTQAELDSFPIEFREGMAARAGLLGDIGPEHPQNWVGPARANATALASAPPQVSLAEVDLLLIVQKDLGEPRELEWTPEHPLYAPVQELLRRSGGVRVLVEEPLQREFMSNPWGSEGSLVKEAVKELVKERFGFADGISQPVVELCAGDEPACDRVGLGEVLVGHTRDRGSDQRYPSGPEAYTKDGSFLVVRKLEQDVEAFERFMDENASQFAGGREELYTKLMGRRKDGRSPIASTSPNAFDYSADPAGDHCPLASHVRRANPRTPVGASVHGLPLRVPRLTRRGFSFGPFSGPGSRGLMFMAYNASIAEQFEVIQRWLNGANSTGVLSAQADPLLSHRQDQVITLLDGREPRYLVKRQPFVKLLWGHYFFAPSKEALRRLGGSDASRQTAALDAAAALEAKGEAIIQNMRKLEALDLASGDSSAARSRFGWKVILEDRGAREQASALWAAIRSDRYHGVLRTSHGVLVGDENRAREVLGDEAHFSVCEYGRRMTESVGLLYLGMDRCPVAAGGAEGYDSAARLPNEFMNGLSRKRGYDLAREAAGHHFEALAPIVDLVEFAKLVVTDVSRTWFGLPRTRAQYDIFHTAALSIFYPSPEPGVRKAAADARHRGELEDAKQEASRANPELAQFLAGSELEPAAIAMALVGGAQGTLAATTGSFLAVAQHGLEHERFGRWANWLASPEGQAWKGDPSAPRGGAEAEPWLVLEVLQAMGEQPTPDILHRRAVSARRLADVEVRAGDTVIVSVASAIAGSGDAASSRELLFGGAYPSEGAAPKHPCPGREAALGAILGMLVSVLEHDVRREGPLRVSPRRWDAPR
jgi:Dyp-type peroxidase family